MKKRWLLLMSLALVMILQLVLPAIAQAAPPLHFAGQGSLEITYMPDPVFLSPKVLLFKDETVAGTIETSVGLPALVGAKLDTLNTSMSEVNWATGNIKGVLKGTFKLTATNGDVMKGTMVATQTGNLFGPVTSKGTWIATERKGVFKNVVPAGKWQSTVAPDLTGMWTGSVTWEGTLLGQDGGQDGGRDR